MTPELVVVGGGPAGLAAAGTFAAAGGAVRVLEAGRYPRTRLCGEFLSPDAEDALATLGVRDLADRLGAPRLAAVRLTSAHAGRTTGDVQRPLPVPGRGVSRWDLDAALAAAVRRLGVDVREGVRVRGIESAERSARVLTADGHVMAPATVVATGRLARPRGVEESSRSAARGWRGVKLHVRGPALPGRTELHCVRGAYVGLNEVALRGEIVVNVCALATAARWSESGATSDGLLAAIARESPAFAARHARFVEVPDSRAAVAAFDFDRRGAVAGSRDTPTLVVGDAAASIVPLAGDGQAMALAAGCAAAQALLLERSGDGMLTPAGARRAAERWRREFGRSFGVRLATGRAVQAALLRPLGAWTLLGVASLVTRLPDVAYRLTRGPLTRPTS